MTTSFENTIDIIIAVLYLFIFPIALINQHKDIVINTVVEKNISSFVDTVAQNGFISKNMYDELNESVSSLLPDYKIELDHEKVLYYPHQQLETRRPEDVTSGLSTKPSVYTNSYTEEIIKMLYEKEQIYYLNKGDFFRVSLMENDKQLLVRKGQTVRSSKDVKGDN